MTTRPRLCCRFVTRRWRLRDRSSTPTVRLLLPTPAPPLEPLPALPALPPDITPGAPDQREQALQRWLHAHTAP